MEKLFHLSTIPKYLEWFEEDWESVQAFAQKHHMDGIELGLTLDYDISRIPMGLVKGVHLSFYPMWLEFWKGEHQVLETILGSKEGIEAYYGGLDREVMIASYRRQYERAKALGAEYMVFHVSHIRPEDSFTWEFSYKDEEIFEATLELVNEAFPKETDGPLLLFENLWWPGLTYLKPELTKDFIERVTYPNKGYLVDVSHLILTNGKIGTEKECYDYIAKIMKNLGETKQYIKGVHLNKTLPRHYMSQNHHYRLEKYQKAKDARQKQSILKQHIQALDVHKPFDHPIAAKIVECINPLYCVYETAPSSKYELAYFIKKQNQALGFIE